MFLQNHKPSVSHNIYFKIPYTLQNIPISFRQSNFFPDSHIRTMSTKISPQNITNSAKSAHSIKICLTVIVVEHATQTGGSSFFQKKGMHEIGMTNT